MPTDRDWHEPEVIPTVSTVLETVRYEFIAADNFFHIL